MAKRDGQWNQDGPREAERQPEQTGLSRKEEKAIPEPFHCRFKRDGAERLGGERVERLDLPPADGEQGAVVVANGARGALTYRQRTGRDLVGVQVNVEKGKLGVAQVSDHGHDTALDQF